MKNNKIIWIILLIAVSFIVYDSSKKETGTYIECYQETATEGNSCGALPGGVYYWYGNWDTQTSVHPTKYYDTSWNSYTRPGGGTGYFLINYTKPIGAQLTSKWKVKDSGGEFNPEVVLDLPESCFTNHPTYLELRVVDKGTVSPNPVSYYCKGNNEWQLLMNRDSGKNLYEEAMIWQVPEQLIESYYSFDIDGADQLYTNDATEISATKSEVGANEGSYYFTSGDIMNLQTYNPLSAIAFWYKVPSPVTSTQGSMTLLSDGTDMELALGPFKDSMTNEIVSFGSNVDGVFVYWTSVHFSEISEGWHHFVIAWSNDLQYYQLYLDGINQGQPLITESSLTPRLFYNTNLYLGKPGSAGFEGYLDEVHVYEMEINQYLVENVYMSVNIITPDQLIQNRNNYLDGTYTLSQYSFLTNKWIKQ